MKKAILLLSALISSLLASLTYAQDSRVLHRTQYCEIVDNKLIETDTITFAIFNQNGEKYSQIYIPYSKMEKLSDIDGWIEDVNGNRIRKLRNTDITDASYPDAGTLYQEVYIKTLILKHNVYPYKVTYTYRVTSKPFLNIADWTPVYYFRIPTDKASLIVKTPANYPIKYKENSIQSHKKDSLPGQIRHTWTASYLKPIPDEEYCTDRQELKPFVKVVPEHFEYGKEGDFKSWESFGNWYSKLTFGLNDLSAEDRREVENITRGITDKKEMVRRIYHYMQDHTRYINISLGIGGFKPYPASYVSANKYGDCKALSNYMKTLLEAVGIPSYLTLIEGDDLPEKVLTDFPSNQFNHLILTVPIDKDTLYLENTSNIHPFDFTGAFIQNREALLINGTKSKLIHIPAMGNNAVRNERIINVNFSNTGNADADLHFRFRGSEFDVFNNLRSDNNPDLQDKQVREYLPLKNYEIIGLDLVKPDRDSAFIMLNTKVNLYKCLEPIGKEFYFSLFPIGTLGFETPENRTLPVSLPFPIIYSDTINYAFPQGYKLKSRPEDKVIQSKFGKCDLHFSDKKNAMTLVRQFELKSGTIEKNEYESFYSFLSQVAESDRTKIVITTAE